MKYTIADVQQEKLMKLSLDIKDAFILTYIRELVGADGIISKVVDDEIYYWIDYQKMLEYMPVLAINNIKVIGRRMTEYEKLNLIKRHIHRKFDDTSGTVSGGYTFINITENFKDLFEISKVKTSLAEVEEKAREMGLVAGGTQKCQQGEPVVLKSADICGHSKVPTIVGTQKCPLYTTNNYTPNNNTTTNCESTENEKPEPQKTSSSSQDFSFLEKKEYLELNLATKNNIKKSFPDLDEEKFQNIYNMTKVEFDKGTVKVFNAALYKGLKGEWEYTDPLINDEQDNLPKEKEEWLSRYTGLKSDPEVYDFVKRNISKIPLDTLEQNKFKLGQMNYYEFKNHINYLSKQAKT